jgi:hypothetical protein
MVSTETSSFSAAPIRDSQFRESTFINNCGAFFSQTFHGFDRAWRVHHGLSFVKELFTPAGRVVAVS